MCILTTIIGWKVCLFQDELACDITTRVSTVGIIRAATNRSSDCQRAAPVFLTVLADVADRGDGTRLGRGSYRKVERGRWQRSRWLATAAAAAERTSEQVESFGSGAQAAALLAASGVRQRFRLSLRSCRAVRCL